MGLAMLLLHRLVIFLSMELPERLVSNLRHDYLDGWTRKPSLSLLACGTASSYSHGLQTAFCVACLLQLLLSPISLEVKKESLLKISGIRWNRQWSPLAESDIFFILQSQPSTEMFHTCKCSGRWAWQCDCCIGWWSFFRWSCRRDLSAIWGMIIWMGGRENRRRQCLCCVSLHPYPDYWHGIQTAFCVDAVSPSP